jgi:hypothetical protein
MQSMLQYYKYVKSYDNTLYQRLHAIYIKQEARGKKGQLIHTFVKVWKMSATCLVETVFEV